MEGERHFNAGDSQLSLGSDAGEVRAGRGPPGGYQRGGAQAGRGPDQLGVESGEGGMLTGRWSRGSLSDGNGGERR